MLRQREYKRAHDDRREDGSPRVKVVEGPEAFGIGKVDADFFICFADSRREQIRVARLPPPAGECDLS